MTNRKTNLYKIRNKSTSSCGGHEFEAPGPESRDSFVSEEDTKNNPKGLSGASKFVGAKDETMIPADYTSCVTIKDIFEKHDEIIERRRNSPNGLSDLDPIIYMPVAFTFFATPDECDPTTGEPLGFGVGSIPTKEYCYGIINILNLIFSGKYPGGGDSMYDLGTKWMADESFTIPLLEATHGISSRIRFAIGPADHTGEDMSEDAIQIIPILKYYKAYPEHVPLSLNDKCQVYGYSATGEELDHLDNNGRVMRYDRMSATTNPPDVQKSDINWRFGKEDKENGAHLKYLQVVFAQSASGLLGSAQFPFKSADFNISKSNTGAMWMNTWYDGSIQEAIQSGMVEAMLHTFAHEFSHELGVWHNFGHGTSNDTILEDWQFQRMYKNVVKRAQDISKGDVGSASVDQTNSFQLHYPQLRQYNLDTGQVEKDDEDTTPTDWTSGLYEPLPTLPNHPELIHYAIPGYTHVKSNFLLENYDDHGIYNSTDSNELRTHYKLFVESPGTLTNNYKDTNVKPTYSVGFNVPTVFRLTPRSENVYDPFLDTVTDDVNSEWPKTIINNTDTLGSNLTLYKGTCDPRNTLKVNPLIFKYLGNGKLDKGTLTALSRRSFMGSTLPSGTIDGVVYNYPVHHGGLTTLFTEANCPCLYNVHSTYIGDLGAAQVGPVTEDGEEVTDPNDSGIYNLFKYAAEQKCSSLNNIAQEDCNENSPDLACYDCVQAELAQYNGYYSLGDSEGISISLDLLPYLNYELDPYWENDYSKITALTGFEYRYDSSKIPLLIGESKFDTVNFNSYTNLIWSHYLSNTSSASFENKTLNFPLANNEGIYNQLADISKYNEHIFSLDQFFQTKNSLHRSLSYSGEHANPSLYTTSGSTQSTRPLKKIVRELVGYLPKEFYGFPAMNEEENVVDYTPFGPLNMTNENASIEGNYKSLFPNWKSIGMRIISGNYYDPDEQESMRNIDVQQYGVNLFSIKNDEDYNAISTQEDSYYEDGTVKDWHNPSGIFNLHYRFTQSRGLQNGLLNAMGTGKRSYSMAYNIMNYAPIYYGFFEGEEDPITDFFFFHSNSRGAFSQHIVFSPHQLLHMEYNVQQGAGGMNLAVDFGAQLAQDHNWPFEIEIGLGQICTLGVINENNYYYIYSSSQEAFDSTNTTPADQTYSSVSQNIVDNKGQYFIGEFQYDPILKSLSDLKGNKLHSVASAVQNNIKVDLGNTYEKMKKFNAVYNKIVNFTN